MTGSAATATPRSHLESSFIEGLRSKYPKACNRSLTNLSVIGLSSTQHAKCRPSLSLSSGCTGDGLSAWSKGLSSSQPDLLKVTDLGFRPLNAGVDVDAPYQRSRTASTDGLHLLQRTRTNSTGQNFSSALTTSVIQERLRESKVKMNEIASKISLISRSNSDLMTIDQQPARLSLPSKQLLISQGAGSDSDDVDDSAPTSSRRTSAGDSGYVTATANIVSSPQSASQSAPPPRLSSSEAKVKLEQLRARLTEKCQSLQKRREALFNRLNSQSRSTAATTSDVPLAPTQDKAPDRLSSESITALPPSSATTATVSTHRKSGTDSDGDSGIDLSLKRSKLVPKNNIAPKLRKYGGSSVLIEKSAVQRPLAEVSDVVDSIEGPQTDGSLAETPAGPKADSVSLTAPNTSTGSVESSSSVRRKSSQSILKECQTDTSPTRSDISKSVRFSREPVVIESTTAKQQELKVLSEQTVNIPESPPLLPDTSLERFDSDSELSSDSDCSYGDLSDVDPRIAQLVLGTRTTPAQNSHTKDRATSQSTDAIPGKDGVLSESVTLCQANGRLTTAVEPLIPSSTQESREQSPETPPSKKDSPPKPPRTYIDDLANDTSGEIEHFEDVVGSVGPYSIVDIAAFRDGNRSRKDNSSNKRAATNARDYKPPIPKSTPPRRSSSSDTTLNQPSSTDNVYEDVVSAKASRGGQSTAAVGADNSRISSRSNRATDIGVDIDLESVVTDDSAGSSLHTSPPVGKDQGRSNSAVSSQISHASSERSTRGRAGSCDDLWGSNASLHSSSEKLGSNSSLSGSRSSLFERVGSFKQAAKKKMKSLKRSLSLDRLGSSSSRSADSRSELPPPTPLSSKARKAPAAVADSSGIPAIKKSLSWKSLNQLKFSKKSAYKPDSAKSSGEKSSLSPKKAVSSPSSASSVASPNHFRPIGKLLELCLDGCRRIQLNKPPHGPYGFYVGQSQHKPGYCVTRLSDSYAEKMFCGLMAVGDEIKEINAIPVTKLSHNEILDIISKSKKLVLKVKPNSTLTSEEWF